MKKCGILASVLILLAACTGKKNIEENNPADQKAKETVTASASLKESPQPATITISDSIPLDPGDSKSPALRVDLSIEPLVLNNIAATEKALNEISYTLTGKETGSLEAACRMYVDNLTQEYKRNLPDYINTRGAEESHYWLNHYYSVTGKHSSGYKGYTTYMLSFEEYTGGAHGYNYNISLSFDPESGKDIALGDVIMENSEDKLIELLQEALTGHFKVKDREELVKNGYIFDKPLFISKNIVFGEKSLKFIYNPYEIACYASGEIILEVEYEKLKDIMKKDAF